MILIRPNKTSFFIGVGLSVLCFLVGWTVLGIIISVVTADMIKKVSPQKGD